MINIYGIFCKTTWKVYYGSTKQNINRRLSEHKSNYNRYLNGKREYGTSFEVIKNNNYEIRLLETCNQENKSDRESFYIRNFDCVNKNIPNRKSKEYERTRKEYHKKWYEQNKEKIKQTISKDKKNEYNKKYYLQNKEKMLRYQKEYTDNNKEKIKDYQIEYRKSVKLKF